MTETLRGSSKIKIKRCRANAGNDRKWVVELEAETVERGFSVCVDR